MQELENKFSVGDLVQVKDIFDLEGLDGIIKQVYQNCCDVSFGGGHWSDWRIDKDRLFYPKPTTETKPQEEKTFLPPLPRYGSKLGVRGYPEYSKVNQDKQISIERLGDKTSITISGHLTKDDVQSILNLIF